MNNGDVHSKTELADTEASQDATLNKYATELNAVISFWVMLGLYLLFESYAPVSISSNSTYYIVAATFVRATIAFWVRIQPVDATH